MANQQDTPKGEDAGSAKNNDGNALAGASKPLAVEAKALDVYYFSKHRIRDFSANHARFIKEEKDAIAELQTDLKEVENGFTRWSEDLKKLQERAKKLDTEEARNDALKYQAFIDTQKDTQKRLQERLKTENIYLTVKNKSYDEAVQGYITSFAVEHKGGLLPSPETPKPAPAQGMTVGQYKPSR